VLDRLAPQSWVHSLLLVALLLLQGCATAQNYLDPAGPLVVGGHALSTVNRSELRIVTFNIRYGEHAERAIDLLSHDRSLAGADVLLLQEMDPAGVELVARGLGMNYVYVPSAIHPASDRDFGVAILAPWPVRDARKLPLPHSHRFRKLRRAAAAAVVDTPLGEVRVYAVHLETPFGASGRVRRDQVMTVLHAAEEGNAPVIVAGDFNGRDAAETIARGGFEWLTREVRRTSRLFSIDHILVRGLCAGAHPSAGKGPNTRGVSDHRPVWAVVRRCP